MGKAFVLFLAGAAVFLWWTAGAMPEVVGSHFAAEGVADGFMPRGQYVAIMLAVVLLVPLLHLERPPLVGATALLFLALFIGMVIVLRRFVRAP